MHCSRKLAAANVCHPYGEDVVLINFSGQPRTIGSNQTNDSMRWETFCGRLAME